MKYDLKTFTIFPSIQWLGIGFMLLALVVVVIIVFRILQDKTKNNFLLWILMLVLLIVGVLINSRTKYVIKDYVDNKKYKLIVADVGLFYNTYRDVDYNDYWKDMNWKTYYINKELKVIYMRRGKYN